MNNDIQSTSSVNNPGVQTVNSSGVQPINNMQPDQPEKKKKNILKILLPILLIGFILLGLFVIFPFVRDNIINNPEHVFKSSIDDAFKMVSSNLKNYQEGVYDIQAKVDTNIEDMKELSDYTYNLRFGVDSKSKLAETKLSISDKKNKKYSIAAYLKDFNLYEEFSNYDKLIDLGEYDSSDFEAMFDTFQNYDPDDVTYLMSVMSDTLKESFDKSKFVKGSKKIEVNGKKINVSKNSYKMDSKEIQRLVKCVLNGLYKDEKSMDIITKTYNIKRSEVKEIIDEISKTEVDNFGDTIDVQSYNDSFLFNIYMNGFDFAGIDIESNNETLVYYYTDNGNFNITYRTLLGNLTMDGIKKKDFTDVKVKYANEEVAGLKVRSFKVDNIDFDYDVFNMMSGNVSYKEEKKGNGTFKFTYKQGSEYINLDMDIKNDPDGKVAQIDEKEAVKLSDEEFEKVVNDFIKSLEDTPFSEILYGDLLFDDNVV